MVPTYTANLPHKLFKAEQVRTNEALVGANLAIDMFTLMQSAGAAVFDMVAEHFDSSIVLTVLCGYGNNGGDGYIVARLAKVAGWQVRLIQLGDRAKITGDAAKARDLWLQNGGQVGSIDEGIESDTVIIDALLGTGLTGNVREPFAQIIGLVNNTRNKAVCSVDVPSGLNADTGQLMGCAINADMTCTFVGIKQGLRTGLSGDYCGKLYFAGLGIGDAFEQTVESSANCASLNDVADRMPRRPLSSHKGQCGHVLLIGGNKGMSGAIRMAAKACLRTGAGLVTVLTHIDNEAIVAIDCAEIMVRGISAETDISQYFDNTDVIVCGPGLGMDDWAQSLLQKVLATKQPKVLDADALNLMAQNPQQLSQCIITPHPKEAARLLKTSVAQVQLDRFQSVTQLAKTSGAVALLKGFGTVISDGVNFNVNTSGNPGMATAGMGDVLSGIIGGLLAQRLCLMDAAVLGAFIHGAAGDRAAVDGERGMMATDLLPHIRALVNAE